MAIFKIFRMNEWTDFQQSGEFKGSPDDLRDGFIHFSTEDHLAGTLARYFKNDRAIIIAVVANENWGKAMKWEEARAGALFPHLFIPLQMTDVLQDWHLTRGGHQPWDLTAIAADLNISFAAPDL